MYRWVATLTLAVTTFVAVVTFAADKAPAQTSGEPRAVVFCHDAALGIVQRKLAGDCTGDVVSAERAEQILDERIERRRRALAAPRKPVVANRKLRSIGTGFFVTSDGKLLTNNHVVEGCGAVSIATPDGRKKQAEVLATRPQDDLALVAAPLRAPAVATFLADSDMKREDPVAVIGYPDQGLAPIRPLLTTGRLGDSGITPNGRPRFKINADIRHGNSGGPVVDGRALVIGVVFAKINTLGVFKRTGEKVRFVGVVIDNRAVFEFLDENRVEYATEKDADSVAGLTLEMALRPLVARIECWK